MSYTLTGLTPGVVYKIAFLAKNEEGDSDLSEYVMIGASSLPAPPANLYKITELSGKTTLTVAWDKVDDIELPVTGYLLQVADFGSVNFKTIYDGSNAPATRQFTKDGFATAARYTFRVLTVNYNGLSEPSEEFTFNSCLAPSGLPSPFRID